MWEWQNRLRDDQNTIIMHLSVAFSIFFTVTLSHYLSYNYVRINISFPISVYAGNKLSGASVAKMGGVYSGLRRTVDQEGFSVSTYKLVSPDGYDMVAVGFTTEQFYERLNDHQSN